MAGPGMDKPVIDLTLCGADAWIMRVKSLKGKTMLPIAFGSHDDVPCWAVVFFEI